MIALVALAGLWIVPTSSIAAPADPVSVDNFALFDHLGHFRELHYFEGDPETKAVLLFIQGNGCPLVRKRVPALNVLREHYRDRGVVCWMINSNLQDERAEVGAEADEFGVEWPILIDETQLIARQLGLTRTAEAILIDTSSWEIVYRGAVDDRLNYQTEKPEAKTEPLKQALEALLAGNEIEQPRTPVLGCRITIPDESGPATAATAYSDTIAPILLNRCVTCHRDGDIGPFAMRNHRKVRGWSEMMREVILTRQMPPWQADPAHGEFANDFSLSPDETRALVAWIDAGAPRGEGPDPLESYDAKPTEWVLGTPDHTIQIPEQPVPATGIIDYRYIEVDSPFPEDTWIRAVEVNPGNTRVLHHVIATIVIGDEKENDGRMLAGYAPGMGPDRFPENTGVLLPANGRIRFQLHYTTSGKAESDLTQLGLYTMDRAPERHLKTGLLIDTKFRIPPHAREFERSKSQKIREDIVLHSMNPHMHFRGKRMRYEVTYPGGEREILLSVPHYHFNWQRSYRLKTPKQIPAGSVITVHAAWDNSALNEYNPDPDQEIGWGEQTFDEMFFATYQYTRANPDPKLTAR